MENLQNTETWVWIAVAVGALLVIGVIAVLAKTKKRAWDHSRAESMRKKVEQELPELRKREAAALETEARAERARAEAEGLETQARDLRHEVEDRRTTLADQLREADERDPRVRDVDDDHSHVDTAARPD